MGAATLDALLKPESRALLGESANFCPSPACDIVYFDKFDRSAKVADLARAVYPKDPTAPICPCFDFTCDEIERDAREGSVARVKAAVERAKSSAARCVQMAANGRSCVPAIQRHYMKCRGNP